MREVLFVPAQQIKGRRKDIEREIAVGSLKESFGSVVQKTVNLLFANTIFKQQGVIFQFEKVTAVLLATVIDPRSIMAFKTLQVGCERNCNAQLLPENKFTDVLQSCAYTLGIDEHNF
jgi:hypothetical protein